MGKETGSDVSGGVCDSDVRNRGRGRSGGQRRGIWEKCQQMQVDGKVEVEQVNM